MDRCVGGEIGVRVIVVGSAVEIEVRKMPAFEVEKTMEGKFGWENRRMEQSGVCSERRKLSTVGQVGYRY